MKFLLEVKDNKANELIALLRELHYVKVKPITNYKFKVLADVKEAVDEMKSVLAGKLEARDADELLEK